MALTACPAKVIAVLGFPVPTLIPCGLLDDGHTEHIYTIRWTS